jgi:hypothetical protein
MHHESLKSEPSIIIYYHIFAAEVSYFEQTALGSLLSQLKQLRKRFHISATNCNCRGIVKNGIEATSRDQPCNRECAAWDSLRTVFQGLGSCSDLRVDLRNRFCQFRLLRTWSAERASRIRRDCDVPANRLRVRPSFMRHPRKVATPQDTSRNAPRIVASGGDTAPATFLNALPR